MLEFENYWPRVIDIEPKFFNGGPSLDIDRYLGKNNFPIKQREVGVLYAGFLSAFNDLMFTVILKEGLLVEPMWPQNLVLGKILLG